MRFVQPFGESGQKERLRTGTGLKECLRRGHLLQSAGADESRPRLLSAARPAWMAVQEAREGPGYPEVIHTCTQHGRPRGSSLFWLDRIVIVVARPGWRVGVTGCFLHESLTPRQGHQHFLQRGFFLVRSWPLVHRRDFNACLKNHEIPTINVRKAIPCAVQSKFPPLPRLHPNSQASISDAIA